VLVAPDVDLSAEETELGWKFYRLLFPVVTIFVIFVACMVAPPVSIAVYEGGCFPCT
jgi:hypothetical protein